jgi:hypothetical protein
VDLANARGGEDNVTVVLYAARPRGPTAGGALASAAVTVLIAMLIAAVIVALLLASGALPGLP